MLRIRSGGGNAGAALEVIVGGLELATLVFMDLEEHNDGEIEIKGLRYRQMDQRIIDTGYGLERFCWAAAGTPTIYETVYPESVKNLRDLSKFNVIVDSLDIPVDTELLGNYLGWQLNINVGTDVEVVLILSSEFLRRVPSPYPKKRYPSHFDYAIQITFKHSARC